MEQQDLHDRSILTAPSTLRRPGPAVLDAVDAHDRGELREQLARRREIGGGRRRVRHAAHVLGIRARQPRDDRRVRGEADDVAGRKRPVELGHRQVLVHDPPSLEEDHPHEFLALDAEQQGHGPHPVGKLARESAEHLRIAIADVVVHRDPAAARRRHDRAARAARKPRDELAHGLLDRAQVVRLDVDRAERGGLLRPEPLLERAHGPGHDDDHVLEPPAGVERARDVVGRLHVEVEVLDAELAERPQDLAHELRRDPATSRVAPDVEIGERPEAGRAPPGEREPDRRPVVLGDERDLGLDDLADLAELLAPRPRAPRGSEPEPRGRSLARARRSPRSRRPPHAGRSPAQPAIRAPASRNCADRFSNGANRSLMRRTSWIESWDPAA